MWIGYDQTQFAQSLCTTSFAHCPHSLCSLCHYRILLCNALQRNALRIGIQEGNSEALSLPWSPLGSAVTALLRLWSEQRSVPPGWWGYDWGYSFSVAK